jgi:hypothetical protein
MYASRIWQAWRDAIAVDKEMIKLNDPRLVTKVRWVMLLVDEAFSY